MKRAAIAWGILVCLLLTFAAIRAQGPQEATEESTVIDKTERVEVELLLIDALVMDNRGRTVPGLTQDDFQMTIAERPASIDTFDVFGSSGPGGDA